MAGEDLDPSWKKDPTTGHYRYQQPQQAPAPDNSTQAPTPAGKSSDASQRSTLSNMWDSWTSRPENNAALLQFGLNMMAPGPGGFMGHLAEGIGGGAEAMSRNVGKQEERQQYEEAQAIKQEEQARKQQETESYGIGQRAAAARAGAMTQMERLNYQDAIRTQGKFKDWALKPEDPLGDTIRETVNLKTGKKYASKAEMLADPAGRKAAWEAFSTMAGDTGGGSEPTATGPDNKKYVVRGNQWVPMTP